MCEFTQGIRGSYQNTGVMLCSVVTYKYEINPGFETSPEFFSDVHRHVRNFYAKKSHENTSLFQNQNQRNGHHGRQRLKLLPSPISGRRPSQAHRRHPHTMGDAACARFGKNPSVGRTVSNMSPRRVCLCAIYVI